MERQGLGVPHGKVRLAPHDPRWNTLYLEEKEKLVGLWKDKALDIQHVGSTSIPNILAKPILDIVIGVEDLSASDAMQPAMAGIGYDYPRDVGIPADLIYGKGTPRTHLVHVVVLNSSQWHQYIVFRDTLCAHPSIAAAYEKLKRELAQMYGDDRAKYTEAKGDFVGDVMRRYLSS